MNHINITSNNIASRVLCPTSKSYANRALILALLKEESVLVKNLPSALDVSDLIENFISLGMNIEQSEDQVVIKSSFPKDEVESLDFIKLPGSEGGTTIRFLIPLLALGKNQYNVKMKGGLSKRPMQELADYITELGGFAKIKGDEFFVKGPIKLNSNLDIDCDTTTQFASAFLMLAAFSNLKVELSNITGSNRYLEMTTSVIQSLKSNAEYTVPYDASSLGYLITYAICKQDLNIQNVYDIDMGQADSMLFEVMDKLDINYLFNEDGLFVPYKNNFSGFEVDGSECIDLVPTLVVLASFAQTSSIIRNIKNLTFKESNRLQGIMNLMDHFLVPYKYDAKIDILSINPSESTQEYVKHLIVEPDHRMIMTATLMLKLRSGGGVEPCLEVSKSFPNFFDIFSK